MQTHTYTYTYIFDGGKPEQTIFLICKTKWEKKDPAGLSKCVAKLAEWVRCLKSWKCSGAQGVRTYLANFQILIAQENAIALILVKGLEKYHYFL